MNSAAAASSYYYSVCWGLANFSLYIILFSLYILYSLFIFTVEQMMMKSEIEVKLNLISFLLKKLYNHARNIHKKMCVKFVSISVCGDFLDRLKNNLFQRQKKKKENEKMWKIGLNFLHKPKMQNKYSPKVSLHFFPEKPSKDKVFNYFFHVFKFM